MPSWSGSDPLAHRPYRASALSFRRAAEIARRSELASAPARLSGGRMAAMSAGSTVHGSTSSAHASRRWRSCHSLRARFLGPERGTRAGSDRDPALARREQGREGESKGARPNVASEMLAPDPRAQCRLRARPAGRDPDVKELEARRWVSRTADVAQRAGDHPPRVHAGRVGNSAGPGVQVNGRHRDWVSPERFCQRLGASPSLTIAFAPVRSRSATCAL